MDISVELDRPNFLFTTGDTVKGCVVVYCPNAAIVVSKISANLTGETTSILTDTTGIFLNTKEEEKHYTLHESQILLPYWNRGDNTRVESLKLGFGYHRFTFALKIPRYPVCLTCPPNSPVFDDGTRVFGSPNLPPSMVGLVKGAEVSYKIDIAVTTYRNLFKSTARRTVEICVWPHDSRPGSILVTSPESFPSTKSVTAIILGSPGLPTPPDTRDSIQQLSSVLEPTRLLITADFPQDYHLSSGPLRHVAMRLVTERLNDSPHSLYLTSFQLLLFGYTDIRAGSASTGQMSCWMIQSLSNLDLRLPNDDEMECDIDPTLWRDKCIPQTAVPSFETCNMSRRYEFEILLGLQCRHDGKAGRVSVVQLLVPVKIGSGLSPDGTVEAFRMAKIPTQPATERDCAVERILSTEGSDEKDVFQAPPTYEEAITMSLDGQRDKDPEQKW